jgi:hypothetical protein
VEFDPPAVGGDQCGHDRQAQAGPAVAGAGWVGAVEAVERVRRVLGRHAGAVVGDGQRYRLAVGLHAEGHCRGGRGVFERVRDQVAEHLP